MADENERSAIERIALALVREMTRLNASNLEFRFGVDDNHGVVLNIHRAPMGYDKSIFDLTTIGMIGRPHGKTCECCDGTGLKPGS